jgi:phage gp36-like protein
MYCTESDLSPYLLQAYITAAKASNSTIVDDHITRVSEQVDAYIGERYELPLSSVPGILNWTASIMVAYRVLGSVTSLVNNESSSDNDFVYLQGEYKRAIKTLEEIRDGKVELFPGSDEEELQDDHSVSVSTPPRRFTDDMLGSY